MFTGIIEEIGKVLEIIRGSQSIRLKIQCSKVMDDIKIGDSVAVNGICLTATHLGDRFFTADVMPETLTKTNLGQLTVASNVNLERALQLSQRLGGHIVSGHIDGVGVIKAKKAEDNAVWLTIGASDSILKYIVMKGSVALDGTSLTVAHVDESSFKVSLIPLTRGETTLGQKEIGDFINIECDVLGKYIEKLLYANNNPSSSPRSISLNFLQENGFA